MFIALEGIDGSGKTTAREFVADWFRAKGKEVVVTREPGGTPMAEKIRSLILSDSSPYEDALTPMGKTLLLMAAREQHIKNVILPNLDRDKVVITDRFCDSTFAYQNYEGVNLIKLMSLHDLAFGSIKPTLTLVMDGDPEVFSKRTDARGDRNYHVKLPLEFHKHNREFYLTMAKCNENRYRIIDTEQDLEGVKAQIEKVLEKFTC